jgi:hypothetical protein
MSKQKFVVSTSGKVAALYSPEVQTVLEKLGEVQIHRASFVEPGSLLRPVAAAELLKRGETPEKLKWYSDMLDTLGVVLGPFQTRDEAVAAEIAALNAQPSALFNAENTHVSTT